MNTFNSYEWNLILMSGIWGGKRETESVCYIHLEVLMASYLVFEFLNFECPTQLTITSDPLPL